MIAVHIGVVTDDIPALGVAVQESVNGVHEETFNEMLGEPRTSDGSVQRVPATSARVNRKSPGVVDVVFFMEEDKSPRYYRETLSLFVLLLRENGCELSGDMHATNDIALESQRSAGSDRLVGEASEA